MILTLVLLCSMDTAQRVRYAVPDLENRDVIWAHLKCGEVQDPCQEVRELAVIRATLFTNNNSCLCSQGLGTMVSHMRHLLSMTKLQIVP